MKPFFVSLATNNGDIGGGEVMLLNLARALRSLNVPVRVIGPSHPSALVDEASALGFVTVVLPAKSRLAYMRAIRRWRHRNRHGILWCNGLIPAVATIGAKRRVVHLHQLPVGAHELLSRLARWRALATLVPSAFMASRLPGTEMLHNWVEPVETYVDSRAREPLFVGFLGRPSVDKGVHVLARAMADLQRETPGRFRLVLAGEARFVASSSQSVVADALRQIDHMIDRTGWITPAEFFSRVDIMVCPSVWPESFGLVVAEALSARVPVIVSDAGALPEVVGPTYRLITPSGDVGALASMIKGAASATSREQLDAGYERWLEFFSPAAGRARLSSLLEKLGIPPDAGHIALRRMTDDDV